MTYYPDMFPPGDPRLQPIRLPEVFGSVLPFPAVTVEARGTNFVKAAPYIQFRPLLLKIHHEVAHHFLIQDIRVGRNSEFIGTGDLPAWYFCERRKAGRPAKFKWGTVKVGEEVAIVVKNLTPTPLLFVAYFEGMAIES